MEQGGTVGLDLDAELLLARAIDTARSYLFAHPEDTLDAGAIARFKKSLGRRIAGEHAKRFEAHSAPSGHPTPRFGRAGGPKGAGDIGGGAWWNLASQNGDAEALFEQTHP